jgi:uncharacterized membrane protein YdbT with pleckstrin-like domain
MSDAAADKQSAPGAEYEMFREHPAMFRNRPFYFVLLTIVLIGGVVGAIMWKVWALIASAIALILFAQWWLKCLGTTLIVTNEGTNIKRGIFSKYTNELWHSDVRNVQIDQTVFQRIMNVGTVNISSGGQADIEIIAHGIPNPHQVHRIIEEQRRKLGQL